MLFLIVNNHDVGCVNNLSAILESRGQTPVVRDRTEALDPGEASTFAGVFLGGSGDLDVSQPYPMSDVRLDVQCLAGGVRAPIFGICEGFEIITSVFGGSLITLPTSPSYDPVLVTLLSHHWIFEGLPDQAEMMEFNQLGADYLPPFLEITASSERSSIEALLHVSRPIVATQFHPEATNPATNEPTPGGLMVVNNFIDYCLGVPQQWW